MELPAVLRQAVDKALEGVPLATLRQAADVLSRRYRAETRDGRLHLSDDLAAKAYLATRLPATYAAVRACLDAVAGMREGFAPRSLLDVGAGPGTAFWAARDCWDSLEDAVLVEASPAIRAVGADLARHAEPITARYLAADVGQKFPDLRSADLVTLAYVLDELSPEKIEPLVDRLWTLTTDTLVIVEPGTPAGWQRILRVRARLVEAGAHLVAPCPRSHACPLIAPDWCHFSRRVARSRLHRLAKGGEVPWEDEKFIYIAASRHAGESAPARVLAPPQASSGMVRLKLCDAEGSVGERLLTRRDGAAFKAARKLDWGDAVWGE
ncbi:ribosomal protein RSM22 (predicted rRNA methylase) [Pseudaminobacter salicylatoxidans]|uniref:Ribosomal protein RSM22 (Predicted rRNA methylase) n=1 Tax=Pseudaminobacter salicylatoxidans TaxID=93369 RepID=A0A316C6Z8_PSESE|nr:small ribosomal subunit Rsm22 family protein [Pseudaminobacter salicylatoxidans]PWJ73570.1 ribosomal protein RSM22 (predicted rRNA methylase) [Pseudaminobacter salicylatoxidans]